MVTAVPSFKWAFCFSFRSPRYKIDSWSYSTRRSPSSSACKTSSLQSTHSFNPKIPNKTPSKRKSNSLPRIGRSSVVPVQKSRGLTKSESDDAGEREQLICRYVWIEEVYTQNCGLPLHHQSGRQEEKPTRSGGNSILLSSCYLYLLGQQVHFYMLAAFKFLWASANAFFYDFPMKFLYC